MYGNGPPMRGQNSGAPPGVATATMMLAACATVLIMPDLDALTSWWVQERAAVHYGMEAGVAARWVWAVCLALLVWSVLRTGFWVAGLALATSAFAKFLPI